MCVCVYVCVCVCVCVCVGVCVCVVVDMCFVCAWVCACVCRCLKEMFFCSVISAVSISSKNFFEMFYDFRYSGVLWGLHNWI